MAEGAPIYPSSYYKEREETAGLYPDPQDPQFAARLYSKREFYEARAVAANIYAGVDPCSSAAAEKLFDLTPVQRIVTRFMHPQTPYMGLLINHGVGVGKTCTAVTIAEQFLETAPKNKVIVLVPQALKDNFKNTVFDPSKLHWNAEEGKWTASQCTGVSYLERLDLLTNPDLAYVTNRVINDRANRYMITGYQAFANYVEKRLASSLPASGLTDEERRTAEDEILRRIFSDHLIIIDEAHNLRDVKFEKYKTVVRPTADATGNEAAENAGGKALNPYLKRICLNAEGLRLVLMTATPMYNEAPEIILLLNYLMMNDSKSDKAIMKVDDFFTADGALIPGSKQAALERVARRYVTYMRGENPFTFPLRMRPLVATENVSEMWPTASATKTPVALTEQDMAVLNALPLVFTEPAPGSPPDVALREATSRRADAAEGGVDAMLDARIQMGNISYPNGLYGIAGWDSHFMVQRDEEAIYGGKQVRKILHYLPKSDFDIDSVFAGEGLMACAPKIHRIVDSVTKARGMSFVYSQYIKGGALPIAVALERAGFQRRMADGRIMPLLKNAPPVAPICAICGDRSTSHTDAHPFRPACYVLLTSDPEITPNFSGLVRQATNFESDPEWAPLGSIVKAVIGSRVASEGLDLKCIREMHIMDPWYHLNRAEQIIGRGIRYCSHSALRAVEAREGLPPMSLNNCLIYLHALHIPEFETADLYAYRLAIAKAQTIGYVQRLLKKHAWDCNLELEAIVFAGLPPRPQIDAQGNRRQTIGDDGGVVDGYSINDQDYTTYCDYQVCRHECAVKVDPATVEIDSSTYTVNDARRMVLQKQDNVRRLFAEQTIVPEILIQEIYSDLPWEIASEALLELLDGRRFKITRKDGLTGFLVKKAGYVVFQPMAVADTDIPMTLRYKRAFQLKRLFMQTGLPVLGRAEDLGEERAPAFTAMATKLPVDMPTVTGLPNGQVAAELPMVLPSVAAGGGVAGGGVTTVAPASIAAGGGNIPVVDTVPSAATISSSEVIKRWIQWHEFVMTNGTANASQSLGNIEIYKLIRFLLVRYNKISEAKLVALRWWFDRLTYPDQRSLYEYAIKSDPRTPHVQSLLTICDTEIFITKSTQGYRIMNPETMLMEYFCTNQQTSSFSSCPSTMVDVVSGMMNKKLTGAMSGMFGFLAPKAGKMVFKSIDINKSAKTTGQVGAECGNVSNMKDHRERVVILQEAVAGTELADLMLNDDATSWDAADPDLKRRRIELTPEHIYDFTQPLICFYMEWLARILHARHVNGQRWFLTGTEAFIAGLKGRAGR